MRHGNGPATGAAALHVPGGQRDEACQGISRFGALGAQLPGAGGAVHHGTRGECGAGRFGQRRSAGGELDSKHRMLGDTSEPTSLYGDLRIVVAGVLTIDVPKLYWHRRNSVTASANPLQIAMRSDRSCR